MVKICQNKMWVKGWVGVSGESYGNQQGWDQPTVNAVVQIRFHRDFIKKWWQNPSSWWSGTILNINRKNCWRKSDTCGASPFFLGLMHLKPTKKSCRVGGRSATEWALRLHILASKNWRFLHQNPTGITGMRENKHVFPHPPTQGTGRN